MAALNHLRHVVFHIVAQIVEAELVVRAVGDVRRIGLAALIVVETMHNHANGHPKELVDLAHPLRVAAGEIVVDGDDMHAFPAKRVEIDCGGGDERLALAGAHLGDRSLVQNEAADQLYVEVPLLQRAFGRLAHRRKGGGGQVIESLSGRKLGPKFVCLGAQLVIGQRPELGLERIDRGDHRPIAFEATIVRRTEHPFHHGVELEGAEHFRPFQCRPPAGFAPLFGSPGLLATTATTKSAKRGPKRPFSRR